MTVFTSTWLQQVYAALSRRRRSLRQRSSGLKCERRMDLSGSVSFERMDIECRCNGMRIMVALWEDSRAWVSVHRRYKRTRAFAVELHVDAWRHPPLELVRRFETTVDLCGQHGPSEELRTLLSDVWLS